jgi:hypothetical protein
MLKSYIIGATAALALTATAASAATLNFVTGDPGDTQTVGLTASTSVNDFTVIGHSFTDTDIWSINGANKDIGNGLELVGGPAYVTYTYLGYEADNSNYSAHLDTSVIFTNPGVNFFQNSVGSGIGPITVTQGSGALLDFSFGTTSPSAALIANNGDADPATSNYAIGYQRISDTSFYVLFDDIASGDGDYDDMVMRIDVAAVPLPAGGLLLLSALFGAGALRRRQKAA